MGRKSKKKEKTKNKNYYNFKTASQERKIMRWGKNLKHKDKQEISFFMEHKTKQKKRTKKERKNIGTTAILRQHGRKFTIRMKNE